MMATRLTQDIQRQVAAGEARGRAEGVVSTIRDLVRVGALPAAAGRARIRAMAKAKRIPSKVAREALSALV
jgi:hypothetical protein